MSIYSFSIIQKVCIQNEPIGCPILTTESDDKSFNHFSLLLAKHITTVDPSIKRPISSPFLINTLSFPIDG